MWKEALIAVGVSAALAGAPALAQQQTQQGQTSQMQGQQAQQYRGWPVFTSDGQQIGEVVEVKSGEGGQEEKLHVSVGDKTVEVEGDKYSAGQNRIELSMSADEAKDLPEAERGS